jgi:CheY-like chemotaxis protein
LTVQEPDADTTAIHVAGLPMSRSLRVLLVEDNDDIAFSMRRFLEKAGHQVATYATAADAVLAVRHGNVDIIALNQRSSRADGVGLIKALRREGIQTPVRMAVSRDDPDLISEAISAGALVDVVVQDRVLAFLNVKFSDLTLFGKLPPIPTLAVVAAVACFGPPLILKEHIPGADFKIMAVVMVVVGLAAGGLFFALSLGLLRLLGLRVLKPPTPSIPS